MILFPLNLKSHKWSIHWSVVNQHAKFFHIQPSSPLHELLEVNLEVHDWNKTRISLTNLCGKYYKFYSPWVDLTHNPLDWFSWNFDMDYKTYKTMFHSSQVLALSVQALLSKHIMSNLKVLSNSFLIIIEFGSLLCTLHTFLCTFQYTMHFLNHLIQTFNFRVRSC